MSPLAGWVLVATLLGASAEQHELEERCAAVALETPPIGASDGPPVVWQPTLWRGAFDSERETLQHWYNWL